MAMWIMTLLVMVAASFAFMMRTEIKMATNFRNEIQAHYLARAGVEYAIAKLRNDTDSYDDLGEAWNLTNYTKPFGGGQFKVTVKDEAGKMNLNSLRPHHWHKLLVLGGTTDDHAQQAINIIDYRDEFDVRTDKTILSPPATEDGFEDYLPPDKDADFDTIREFQKVKEIGAAAWLAQKENITVYSEDYNTDVNRNSRTNINAPTTMETLRDDLGITEDQALAIIGGRTYTDQHWIYELSLVSPTINIQAKADEISYSSYTPTIDCSFGKGTININTASETILKAFGFDSTDAPAIINYRETTGPFDTRGKILAVPGIVPTDFDALAEPFSDLLTVRSDRFRIVSEGYIPDATNPIAKRKIEVVVDRDYHDDGTMGPIKILYWSEHMD